MIPIGQWGSQQVKGQGRRHLLRRRAPPRPWDVRWTWPIYATAEPTARTLVEVTNRISDGNPREEVATLRGEDPPVRLTDRPPAAGSKAAPGGDGGS